MEEIIEMATQLVRPPRKSPGPDHPITIEPAGRRVTVRCFGRTIADSRDALVLREASYPAVFYLPRQDVDMGQLVRSDHLTHCPYKGDAAYYTIEVAGQRSANAVWTYEEPFPAVGAIAEHLAFYPDRVEAIEVAAG